MTEDTEQYTSVRFRRGDVAALETYPSSGGAARVALRKSALWSWFRILIGVACGFATLLLVLALTIHLIGMGDFGEERMRTKAQQIITNFAGFDVATSIGDVRLVLSGRSLIAMEIENIDLARAETSQSLLRAKTLRLGFRLLPLLRGRIELDSADIADARLVAENLPQLGKSDVLWDGKIEPRRISEQLFQGVQNAYAFSEKAGTRSITARNVEIVPGDDTKLGTITISHLAASRSLLGVLAFDGEAAFNDRIATFGGKASRPLAGGPVRTVGLNFALLEGEQEALAEPAEDEVAVGRLEALGTVNGSVTGKQDATGTGSSLAMRVAFDKASVNLGKDGILTASGEIQAGVNDASDAITINKGQLSIGRSDFAFTGSVQPDGNAVEDGGHQTYVYRLQSERSVVAPVDSPERMVPFAARIEGRIDPQAGRLQADRIQVATGTGQITASAAVTLKKDKSPGLSLAVFTKGMPTSQVKQFWPWFAAPGARRWTLENLFGGEVVEGNLRLRTEPGRLGDGNPLTDEEVSGQFEVVNARFDVAGEIPPVRDAHGKVKFAGSDIDISISSGAVFMPSGRKVAAKNGSLVIRNAHLRPRIGKLEIDVAGDAPAVIELASYEPIDASKFLELEPEDVTGNVTGTVVADIPLHDGIPRDMLSWRVTLEYDGVSIAKPFAGQSVANAKGVVIVEPERADISASATLNGIPARLEMVEPLGKEKGARARNIVLKLDDKMRARMFPGLDAILTGPTEVTYEQLSDKRQKIRVQLDKAKLSLPWLNWSKGAGIPATASFVMENSKNRVKLSDFKLSGESFAANGSLEFASGSLVSANLDHVRLNRGDAVSAIIRKSGNGYKVSIRGSALDARSVIKHYLGAAEARLGGIGKADDTPVALDATLDRMTGFNDEAITNVRLTYDGIGGSTGQLEIKADTRSGAGVTMSQSGAASARQVRLQSADAGAVLRLLDLYKHMQGGRIDLGLQGNNNDRLQGQADIRDFWIVDEPRLRSLVAASSSDGDDSRVDANRVSFERGFAAITKGNGALALSNGVLRGPLIGTTFQGQLYDASNNIAITGTFMPLYGLNRIFGEIPLFGQILGNGRDRGLIGITYRLYGKVQEPEIQINPISVIAPGIFRQIFEFR